MRLGSRASQRTSLPATVAPKMSSRLSTDTDPVAPAATSEAAPGPTRTGPATLSGTPFESYDATRSMRTETIETDGDTRARL